jgi:hypothetical protein
MSGDLKTRLQNSGRAALVALAALVVVSAGATLAEAKGKNGGGDGGSSVEAVGATDATTTNDSTARVGRHGAKGTNETSADVTTKKGKVSTSTTARAKVRHKHNGNTVAKAGATGSAAAGNKTADANVEVKAVGGHKGKAVVTAGDVTVKAKAGGKVKVTGADPSDVSIVKNGKSRTVTVNTGDEQVNITVNKHNAYASGSDCADCTDPSTGTWVEAMAYASRKLAYAGAMAYAWAEHCYTSAGSGSAAYATLCRKDAPCAP